MTGQSNFTRGVLRNSTTTHHKDTKNGQGSTPTANPCTAATLYLLTITITIPRRFFIFYNSMQGSISQLVELEEIMNQHQHQHGPPAVVPTSFENLTTFHRTV